MSSILQTELWAKFKRYSGWQARREAGVLALSKNLPFGLRLTYYPELPFQAATLELIKQASDRHSTRDIFVRFEFLEPWSEEAARALLSLGLVKSFEEVQPEYRQWLRLDRSETDLLQEMKPKGRYNIRIARKHRLKIYATTEPEAVDRFFRLYQASAQRNKFTHRSPDYFRRLVELLNRERTGEIMVVSRHDQPLAAAIVSYYQGVATYLYGGSAGDRSLMAPYLLHWEIIRRARSKGCQLYDLLAIAPPNQADHPYLGLTRFKSQFGGAPVRLLGSWDFVYKPTWYKIYRWLERRRRKVVQ